MVLEAGCRAHIDDRSTVTDVDPAVQYTALTGCLPGRQQARDASALQHSGSLIACTCAVSVRCLTSLIQFLLLVSLVTMSNDSKGVVT